MRAYAKGDLSLAIILAPPPINNGSFFILEKSLRLEKTFERD